MKPETENTPVVIEPGNIQTMPQTTPATILEIAIAKGADINTLEKLMEMQERKDANDAKKAYHKAMAEFKAGAISIVKDKKGHTNFFASLANILDVVTPLLGEHGLTLSWKTNQKDNLVTVSAIITHKLGHSEQTSLTSGLEQSGNKSSIHGLGSAISYLERYTAKAILGIAEKDQDDDGVKSDPDKFLTEDQIANINAMIDSTGTHLDVVLRFGGVEKLEYFPRSKYNALMITWEKA